MDNLAVNAGALSILIALSAFFSGSEAALFSLSRSQVSQLASAGRGGRMVASLLERPRRLLITILIGNLVVNVFATSAATDVFVRRFGASGIVYAFVTMSIVVIVFGEIFPKVLAFNAARRAALMSIYPLRFLQVLLYPMVVPIDAFTNRIIDFLKHRVGVARQHLSKEELITAFEIGHGDGFVGAFEHDLFTNIIEFRDTVVKEIMSPSIQVVSLAITMSRGDMEEHMVDNDVSRVPVYGESPDDILGVLHIKDLAGMPHDSDDVTSILRAPHYVPESARISQLFRDMGRERVQMGVVIDEHGSFAGLVTMEDILEELVGEIRDAKEPKTVDHTFTSAGRIVVAGTMEIDEFNDLFGTRIEDDDNETVAGYVTSAVGDIPAEGQTIELGDLRFLILAADPNRIRKMRVERI